MDLAHRWSDTALGRWLSRGLPALSRGSPDPERTLGFRKKLIGATLIFAAVAFAYWAQDLARISALRSWKRTHTPSARIWASALTSRSFSPVRDPRLLQKDTRALPMRLDAQGSVWISPGSEWIAVFSDPNQAVPITIYCWECTRPPLKWVSLGAGWDAFDSALRTIDRALEHRQKATKTRKLLEIRDPREILY